MKTKSIIILLGSVLLGLGSLSPLRAQGFSVLHTFASTPDGANPGGLVVNGGMLFGTTLSGGGSGGGTVFACSTNGSGLTVLHTFTNTPDGAEPHELLLLNNSLYGITRSGGAFGWGSVFKLGTNGTGYTLLHSFTNLPDGSNPLAGLTADANLLYGTTAWGGAGGNGIVFRMDTNGAGYTMLHVFTNTPDGANPYASLVLSGTNLYGTTYSGGLNGRGMVFKLATNGTSFAVLCNFSNAPEAASPYGKLVLVSNVLYGTTSSGGSAGSAGTIFKLATNGTGYAVLHNFTGPTAPASNSDGGSPKAGLSYNAGLLYGDTSGGGSGDGGTVFQMNLNGTGFAVLKHLTNAVDGSIPQASLVFNDTYNTLFGTTYYGPDVGSGVLFSLRLAPVITGQPLNVTVTSGNPATFTVVAGGQNPLAYQWYYNANTGSPNLLGSSLAGQTSNTLSFTSATNSGGYYSVLITNAVGAVTSAPALLTVTTAIIKPSITAQPQPLTVTNGLAANFSVTASGQTPLAYQWYFNANTGSPNLLGNSLAGQTSSTLSFTSATNSGGYYSVIVTNAGGAATSTPALLTVVTPIAKPSLTAQPQPTSVTNGFTANFSVTATGQEPLSYQWYFNTNTLLPGQTGSTLSFPAATNNAGYYSVIITNTGGAVTSSAALLTVLPAGPPLPTITVPPQNLTVTNGYPATFSVTATADPLTYQWYFNTNTLLAGQTNSSVTIASAITTDAGAYTVAVANPAGAVTSSPAILTVITNTQPVIVVQPQNLFATNGLPATFSVSALGQSPLRYQWYSNTVSTALGTLLAGMTNSTFAFTGSTNGNGRYYAVVITNTLGKATSSPALLTVITKPLITTNPQPVTVSVGSPANFSVVALGQTMRFQWYSNTVATTVGTLLAGQTNNAYSFISITNANGCFYSVIITNTFGKATSSPALLTVSALPYITLQPSNATLIYGSSVTFTSAAAGPGPLSYQWLYQTNQIVAGATNTALTITNTALAGTYSMKAANSFGSVTSSPALLVASAAPYITLQPLGATITNGSPVTFTSAAAGPGPLVYQWFFQTNLLIAGATNPTLTFTNANQPGAYAMVVTNSFGAATSSVAQLTVAGRPLMLSAKFDAASGSYTFGYVNLAGSTNRLWASTNLAATNFWRALATNVMAPNAPWFITDSNTAKTNKARFYRFSTP